MADGEHVRVERRLVVDLLAAPPLFELLERRDILHPVHLWVVAVATQPIPVGDLLGPDGERVHVTAIEHLLDVAQRREPVVGEVARTQPKSHEQEDAENDQLASSRSGRVHRWGT